MARGSPFTANDCRNNFLQVVDVFGAFTRCLAITGLLHSTSEVWEIEKYLLGNFNLTFTIACSHMSRAKSDPAKDFFRIRIKRIVSSFLGQKKNIRIFVVGLTNGIRQLSHITGFPLGQILVTC